MHNKDKYEKHIPHKLRAQFAAKYLSETQWGKTSEPDPSLENETPIIPQERQEYNINYLYILIEEIKAAIRKVKRRKAQGPDEIPTERLKELS